MNTALLAMKAGNLASLETIMIQIRMRIGACLLVMAVLAFPLPSLADSADDISVLKEQLQQTRKMLETMKKHLLQLEQKQNAQQEAQEQTQAAVQQQAETVADVASSASAGGSSSPNAFNPEISAVLNGKYQIFSQSPDGFAIPGFPMGNAAGLDDRGLSLSESELDVASNVDNLFFGSLTVSLDQGGGADVEEAFFQTLGMPLGLTLKAGRFFSGIGYLNQFHTHHDDFIDRPLPYRAFLNTQFGDDGVQLKWLAPTDRFVELGGELLRGDAFPAAGAAHRGVGTWSVFAHTGGDVGISNSWKTGISYLRSSAHNRDAFDNKDNTIGDFSGNSRLWLADFVWKWAPNGNPVNRNFPFRVRAFIAASMAISEALRPLLSMMVVNMAGIRKAFTSLRRAGNSDSGTHNCTPTTAARPSPKAAFSMTGTIRTATAWYWVFPTVNFPASVCSFHATTRKRSGTTSFPCNI